MLTGFILFILCVGFFVFFIYYKRNMLAKMFSLHASVPAGQLQEQLELTADTVIERLETHIAHLELLLDEADGKIAMLDQKLRVSDYVLAELESTTAPRPQQNKKVDLTLLAETPAVFADIASRQPAQVVEIPVVKDVKDNLGGDKRRQIMTMAGQGYSVTDIAKTTGLGKGEIMLMLQLNRK